MSRGRHRHLASSSSSLSSQLITLAALPLLARVPLWALSVCALTLSSSAFAAQITLGWDPDHDPAVAGYILYYGSASGEYEGAIDVGLQSTYTLTDLEDGQSYYFAVTAYDVHGNESELSAEAVHDHTRRDTEAAHEGAGPIDRDDDTTDEDMSTDEAPPPISDDDEEEDDHDSDLAQTDREVHEEGHRHAY